MRTLFPISIALLLTSAAHAGDGVLEINSSCALNNGCFSGDTAGFPVTITTTGSYRLTSNLPLPTADTSGIVVSASGVSVDLNGFAIAGPVVCQGVPTSCVPATGTGVGIDATGFPGVRVRNGTVSGMGFRGVDLSSHAIVENVHARSNRAQQIFVSVGSIVRDNVVHAGGNVGIQTGAGSLVTGNSVSDHGNVGIQTGSGSTVTNNTAYENQADGISTSTGSILAGNMSYSNLGDGIQASTSSLAQRNATNENTGFGIHGITALAPVAYRNNMIRLNQAGAVDGGIDLGGNLCSTISPCP